MAMRWLIDDGPLNDLAEVFRNRHEIFPEGLFLVSQPTANESRQWPPRQDFVESPACRVFDFKAQSQVGEILYRLRDLPRNPRPTADLGEHYAIAWLLSEEAPPAVVFVATDKKALALALAELKGERVSHTYQLWLELYREGFFDYADLEKLLNKTWNSDSSLPKRPWRMPASPR
jgi:hypothetical protein